ncbi:hypothetical protein [Flavobacterium silvaticum]|uniref:Uncharacterized protein n=1 Tax=Flavobacterium silvaticum TaxID=1852020 RepID=A0A972JGY8_9FLAO|nr:hypothetical protein [Flavobacterium silvaticum]NMH26563.1 hypothetical protein [Flavobacterium silvaticum]
MTAEIGILNKTSVVLAADSAATISSHRKVFNTANKLFPLSNYEPVGLMIYNNSNWMGIPLEIIVKSYTKTLQDKSFPALLEYRDDFLKFVKENFKRFINSDQIHELISFRLYDLLETLSETFKQIIDENAELWKDFTPDQFTYESELEFSKMLDMYSKITDDILPEFSSYKLEEFKLEFKKTIDKILPGFYVKNKVSRKSKYTQKIYKVLFNELTCKFSDDEDFTGIVIAGYGTDEIFPSICDIRLGEILDNKLRFDFSMTDSISINESAIVCPFAQRDMVDTFFLGINPQISEELGTILIEELENSMKSFSKKYPEFSKDELKIHFGKIFENYSKRLRNYCVKNHINPIIKSVGYLRKEDLVELAESVINITSIKRKTNSDIQSVGGPIDIAVITKHEGFIWIKRKDSINKDINSAFFNREFKKY